MNNPTTASSTAAPAIVRLTNLQTGDTSACTGTLNPQELIALLGPHSPKLDAHQGKDRTYLALSHHEFIDEFSDEIIPHLAKIEQSLYKNALRGSDIDEHARNTVKLVAERGARYVIGGITYGPSDNVNISSIDLRLISQPVTAATPTVIVSPIGQVIFGHCTEHNWVHAKYYSTADLTEQDLKIAKDINARGYIALHELGSSIVNILITIQLLWNH